MKYNHTHLKLFLLFGVFAVFLFNCKKDKPETEERKQEYFEGKVNGQEIETYGHMGCPATSAYYYPDGFLDYEPGHFVFRARNCNEFSSLNIGLGSNIHEAVFDSCGEVPLQGAWCSYMNGEADYEIIATECLSIRLEITFLQPGTSTKSGFVEGLLDAVIRDTIIDSTFVISDVKFGARL
jgi:hypothetical protein